MVFACQADSFLKEFSSKVVSCKPTNIEIVQNGKKEVIDGFEVVLEDTILFPEGGGQPYDQGFLNDVPVLQVTRRGAEAIHFVTAPLSVGDVVSQKIDWERRLDHMQQHSGQHLVTAVIETEYGCPTTSWWLGEETSYVELDTTNFDKEKIEKVEEIVNEKIRAATPVSVQVYEAGDPWLTSARTRGLPDDHVGSVRVVTIEGVDSNMCCGTHVTNLSQLQAIKMLHAEKGKKNKINLHFLVGGRVLKHLAKCLEREQKLTALLKNGPEAHADLVDKLQKSWKITNKSLQAALKEIAAYEAQKFKQQNPLPQYYCLHRKDGDFNFMSTFVNEIGTQGTLLFLTVGEEKGEGQMLLCGDEGVVNILGPKICKLLDGKGAGKGGRFQAKLSKLNRRSEAVHLIQQHFSITENVKDF